MCLGVHVQGVLKGCHGRFIASQLPVVEPQIVVGVGIGGVGADDLAVGGDGLLGFFQTDVAVAQSEPGVGVVRAGCHRFLEIVQSLFVFPADGEAEALPAQVLHFLGVVLDPGISPFPKGRLCVVCFQFRQVGAGDGEI